MKIKTIKHYKKDRCLGKYVEIDGKTYNIKVYYRLGGMNPFSYKTEARGIVLSVTPIELQFDDQGEVLWTTTTAYTGLKELVTPLTRFSNGRLEDAYWSYIGPSSGVNHSRTKEIIDAVIEMNKEKEPA